MECFPSRSAPFHHDFCHYLKKSTPTDCCPHSTWGIPYLPWPPPLSFLNNSLKLGIVPDTFKSAEIIPILKKPNSDPSVLSNYWPISLLPYLGKVLEAHVANCLSSFIEQSHFLDSHQAGFRPAHSTESVILAVMDELRGGMDRGLTQALILLDLSAAFDTVDHDILIDRVSNARIQGLALRWISPFLSNSSQSVRLANFAPPRKWN